MGVLFPLYLLGALGVILPIVLHLRRRPPQDRLVFPSLMFLSPHPPEERKRSQIQDWILLALRCLVLGLLALLFARPFLRSSEEGAGGAGGLRKVILVDASGSLQRGALLAQAKAALGEELTNSSSRDQVAVVLFSDVRTPLWTFSEDRESQSAEWRNESILARWDGRSSEGWGRSHLDEALKEALAWLEDEGDAGGRKEEIVVISDWQEGLRATGLELFDWPEKVSVRREDLVADAAKVSAGNAVMHLVGGASEEDEAAGQVRVRFTNALDATAETFSLFWEGREAEAMSALVPAGASRVLAAPPRTNETVLMFAGDALPFDNRLFVAAPKARPVRLLIIRSEESGNTAAARQPSFFLERALSETAALRPEVEVIGAGSPISWEWADVIVVDGSVEEALRNDATEFVDRGGILWLPLRSNVEKERLPVLAGWDGLTLSEAVVSEYAMWSGLDFEDPVLRPFAPPQLRDFSKIRVWAYRRLAWSEGMEPEGLRILASYDQGGPALLQIPVGKGQAWVFSAGLSAEDSDLVLSSKFVPLLYTLLQEAGFASEARRSVFVGDKLPNGKIASLPGIEVLGNDDLEVAVNLPVEESQLDVLPEDLLPGMGIPASLPRSAAKSEEELMKLREAELEHQQKAWRWFLVLVLSLLIAETWWANRKRRAGLSEATAA
ncbi:MAG: BatA domain-containing protein [Verrucomicrobiota bacterium]